MTKVHQNEHHCNVKNVAVMDFLAQQNHKIDALECKCHSLINLVSNLSKSSQSTVSNLMFSTSFHPNFRDDKIVHQLLGYMDIGNQETPPAIQGPREEPIIISSGNVL
jgi:hypothetical protein